MNTKREAAGNDYLLPIAKNGQISNQIETVFTELAALIL
jgi:hypothetical protein